MPAVLVVTTEGVPGYRITSVMGQVVGSIARLSNAFTEGIRTMDGQLNPHRGQDLAQWRTDAVNAMIEEARKKGANAVIGTRFDNRLISTAWAEICAYGTAVRVDPQDGPPADGATPAQPPRASSPVVPPPKESAAAPDGGSPHDPPQDSPREEPQDEVVWRRPKGAESPEHGSPERGSSSERGSSERGSSEPEAGSHGTADSRQPADSREPGPGSRGSRDAGSRNAAGSRYAGRHEAEVEVPQGADDPATIAAEPSATGWPEETGPEPDERVGPERLRPEEPDPDWPDTPTDPSLRIPD